MKNLNKNELLLVSGGASEEREVPTEEKVKDVINDGLEGIGDTLDTISDKIHKNVDKHYSK